MDTLGVYIHVPFCCSKCYYCDFYSGVGNEGEMEAYKQALQSQIRAYGAVAAGRLVDTVYVGGGTPTVLPAAWLCEILKTLGEVFTIDKNAEITVECNPQTGRENELFLLREAGFNRLSIGLQSAQGNELSRLGRRHDLAAFSATVQAARAAGFRNISADVMMGIPEQTTDSFKETLHALLAHAPEHVSAYGLRVEEGTRFAAMGDRLVLPDDDAVADMQEMATALLREAGYRRYEISNYGKGGAYSRHNMRYWLGADYIGFGAAAHSFLDGWRFEAPRSKKAFLDAAARGAWRELAKEAYRVEGLDARNEYIMLRMRLAEGIDTLDFKQRFGVDLEACCGSLDTLIAGGIIKKEGKRVAFTDKGMYVSNAVLSDWLVFEEGENGAS